MSSSSIVVISMSLKKSTVLSPEKSSSVASGSKLVDSERSVDSMEVSSDEEGTRNTMVVLLGTADGASKVVAVAGAVIVEKEVVITVSVSSNKSDVASKNKVLSSNSSVSSGSSISSVGDGEGSISSVDVWLAVISELSSTIETVNSFSSDGSRSSIVTDDGDISVTSVGEAVTIKAVSVSVSVAVGRSSCVDVFAVESSVVKIVAVSTGLKLKLDVLRTDSVKLCSTLVAVLETNSISLVSISTSVASALISKVANKSSENAVSVGAIVSVADVLLVEDVGVGLSSVVVAETDTAMIVEELMFVAMDDGCAEVSTTKKERDDCSISIVSVGRTSNSVSVGRTSNSVSVGRTSNSVSNVENSKTVSSRSSENVSVVVITSEGTTIAVEVAACDGVVELSNTAVDIIGVEVVTLREEAVEDRFTEGANVVVLKDISVELGVGVGTAVGISVEVSTVVVVRNIVLFTSAEDGVKITEFSVEKISSPTVTWRSELTALVVVEMLMVLTNVEETRLMVAVAVAVVLIVIAVVVMTTCSVVDTFNSSNEKLKLSEAETVVGFMLSMLMVEVTISSCERSDDIAISAMVLVAATEETVGSIMSVDVSISVVLALSSGPEEDTDKTIDVKALLMDVAVVLSVVVTVGITLGSKLLVKLTVVDENPPSEVVVGKTRLLNSS